MNIKNKVRSSYPSNAQGINHNIAENAIVDLTQYKVQPESTLPPLPKNLLAERILQDYAVTCLPSATKFIANPNKKYQGIDARQDLEYLNLKLDAVRKTITSGDVYNIKGVAETIDDVDRMYTTATPNTAFISNVHIAKNSVRDEIAPGDIIFTDLNNVHHIIQHGAAGYFYPSQGQRLPNSNTYKLIYSGSTDLPLEGTKNIDGLVQPAEAYDKIEATINAGQQIGFAEHFSLAGNSYITFSYIQGRVPLATAFTSGGEKIGLDNLLTRVNDLEGKLSNDTLLNIQVEVR